MTAFESSLNLRKFRNARDETIPRKVVGKVLEAGRHAPSPDNIQSLEFIAVEDDSLREFLARETGEDRLEDAPTLIVLVSDIPRMKRRLGSAQGEIAARKEAACAAQNMRLVATENDLCSIWVSGFDEEAVSGELEVPGGKLATSIVALAYSDNPVPQDKKFRMNQTTFYDKYDNQIGSAFDGLSWEGIRNEKRVYGKKGKGLLDKLRRKIRKVL
jgi:nitroreductase